LPRLLKAALDHLEEGVIALFLATATLILFASIVHRYASGIPALWEYTQHVSFNWAQELTIYLLIWMAKFGAAYGVRTGIHVGVDVLVRKLSERWQRVFVVFSLLSGAFFTAVIAWLGASFVLRVRQLGQVSPDLELPMWIIYLAIPLGSSLMCFRFLEVLVNYLKGHPLPSHSYAEIETGVETPDVELKPRT
jgi:C4-dicarboxylate transporter DctQ subunit